MFVEASGFTTQDGVITATFGDVMENEEVTASDERQNSDSIDVALVGNNSVNNAIEMFSKVLLMLQ